MFNELIFFCFHSGRYVVEEAPPRKYTKSCKRLKLDLSVSNGTKSTLC